MLEVLFLGLGYNNDPVPKHSLHPHVEPKRMSFNISPAGLIFLMLVGMVLFVIFIFLFTGVSAVESGTYYNGFNNVI